MKTLTMFVRTTVLGGALFLVPVIVVIFVLGKAFDAVRGALAPIAKLFPDAWVSGPTGEAMLGLLILAAACFLAGLVANTQGARTLVSVLETTVLSRLPGYIYFKEAGASVMGLENEVGHAVVLARIGDSWRLAVRTEADAGGLVAVFLPNSPNPFSGSVLFLPPDRVRVLDVPLAMVIACLRRCGTGADALLAERAAQT